MKTGESMKRLLTVSLFAMTLNATFAVAQNEAPNEKAAAAINLKQQPTLFVVPYAHLDTQWNWDMQQSISEYMLKTLRLNFYYMDKYPHYVFNWTGSNRYRLMKEYFPDDYAKMKHYVAKGQWYPSGSSVEENDVNLPGGEAILRQVLYGNEYFRHEFGKAPEDYMLPDCFGFPNSLPEILAHAGVKGFSTQKLNANWQPSPLVGGADSPEQTPEGIPYNVGIWEGPDGSTIMAALNPGAYSLGTHSDLSKAPVAGAEAPRGPHEPDWVSRIALDGKVTGVFADYHYVGTGDIGGATDEESVRLLEAMATHGTAVLPGPDWARHHGPVEAPQGTAVTLGDGPVKVVEAGSDWLFKDVKPDMQTRLPRYKGDLELINHSAGSLTSEAYHKRWNRKNELLADAAEEASVAANWMGGRAYPQQRLNDAWNLVLSGQFHDSGAGTASPRSYQFTQNDDVIAMNQFAGVLTSATQAIASAMDTDGAGVPVVVYNSLNVAREDVVKAAVSFDGEKPEAVHVVGPDGKVVASQMDEGKVMFLAKVPSIGYAVYHVLKGAGPAESADGELKVSEGMLENSHYRVKLDANGDVSSIWDKALDKELLSAPVRLAISTDTPRQWPAWNMDFDQEQAAPRAYVGGPATVRVVENGPVRVAIEVTRETEGSKFAQTVRLSSGAAGDRVEFSDAIDWHTLASNLKATFALAASNKTATYSWDVGTIERPNAFERSFEVGTHHWIDLTDASGKFGATVLTDVKNGSDKRDDNTIRLTLLRSPGYRPEAKGHPYNNQQVQDWGHHQILFGITGHADGWREGESYWTAFRLSNPLESFVTEPHAGKLGKTFSIASVSDSHVRVLALKKAEESDAVVVRMVELDGKPAKDVRVKFAGPVESATAVNGQEQAEGPATVKGGELETSFMPYQMQSFAVKLGAPPVRLNAVKAEPVKLAYDLAASSNDDTKTVGGFDAQGDALPAEMLPATVSVDGVELHLAPAGTGKMDAVVAKGQKIQLPAGDYNTVYVLAASADGDQDTTFEVGGTAVKVPVQNWGGFVGQWDTRVWKAPPAGIKTEWAVSANHAPWDLTNEGSKWWMPSYPDDFLGLKPGYIKRSDIAWYASHHHTADGLNEPYEYSYLFAYAVKLPAHARTLTLPDNDKVRVLAVSVAKQEPDVTAGAPLYDTLGASEPGELVAAK